MKRYLRALSAVAGAALAAATPQYASAYEKVHEMSRGVYAEGKVHYFAVGTSSDKAGVTHYPGTVARDANGFLTWSCADKAQDSLDNGFCSFQDARSNAIAVEGKLYFAFTAWKGCKKSNGTSSYVVQYDFSGYPDEKDAAKRWGPVPLEPLVRTNHQNSGDNGDSAGVAIVSFGGLLYVFDDTGTHTSANAAAWESHDGLPLSLVNGGHDPDMEPLDAITYTPPGEAPQIVVIYAKLSATNNDTVGWDSLYAVHWNGKLDGTGQATIQTLTSLLGTDKRRIYAGALLAGTARGTSYSWDETGGALAPSLQLFVVYREKTGSWYDTLSRLAFSYGPSAAAKNEWVSGSKTLWLNGDRVPSQRFYPTYETVCADESSILRQKLVVDGYVSNEYDSDFLVPGYTYDRDTSDHCEDQAGEATDTTENMNSDMSVLRKYWTLSGIIFGPPPFAVNGMSDVMALAELSNLEFAQSSTTSTEISNSTKNTVLASAGYKLTGGLKWIGARSPKKENGLGGGLDASYKHAWDYEHSSETSVKTGIAFKLGTNAETKDKVPAETLGRHGYAIFSVPTLSNQYYRLYSYDRAYSGGTLTKEGTPLNQDLNTVRVLEGAVKLEAVPFLLEDPAACGLGEACEGTGLMAGMSGAFSPSTDLDGWVTDWQMEKPVDQEANPVDWYTLLGPNTPKTPLSPVQFGKGISSSVTFETDNQTHTTNGDTNSVEARLQVTMESSMAMKGFEDPWKRELEVSAGYEGEFSTATTSSLKLGKDVTATLGMEDCEEPGCVRSLVVQPYLLAAVTSSAPWIPTAYAAQLPWAIMWRVNSYTTVGGERSGVSPAPDEASGQVAGGSGASALAAGASPNGYSLRGGRLSWTEPDGTLAPIPMHAGDFDPDKGVTLSLNGYSWSSARANGKWKRSGKTWTFATRKGATRDVVTLSLDFGERTWSLDLGRLALPFLKANETRAHLKLTVNGRYGFFFDSEHDAASAWDLVVPPGPAHEYHLARYAGSYDSATGKGVVTLEGTLPEEPGPFGDVSFVVNGHEIHVPVRSHPEFRSARDFGRKLVVRNGGMRLTVDFGRRKWSARFRGTALRPLHAPRLGKAAVAMAIGGVTKLSVALRIDNFTSTLVARNGRRPSGLASSAAAAASQPDPAPSDEEDDAE
jgi:hypothetical protein